MGGRGGHTVAVAQAEPRVDLLQFQSQGRLDRLGGGACHGQAVRVDGAEVARQVDDAEQRAGVGIVDRRGRARPALHGLVEVLGAEDLDGVVGRDRGPDRVRPRPGLAPQHALGEVHHLGRAPPHRARALDAEQHAGLVADHDQVPGLLGHLGQAGVDQLGMAAQRVLGVPVVHLELVGHDGRELAPGRVHAGVQRPPPRVRDRPAHIRIALVVLAEEQLPREPELLGAQSRRRRGVDGHPRIGGALAQVRSLLSMIRLSRGCLCAGALHELRI